MQKKGEGSQVKESTDSNTTLEDEDVKGKCNILVYWICNFINYEDFRIHINDKTFCAFSLKKKEKKNYK